MSVCIGCSCDDSNACWDEEEGEACHWLAVDHEMKIGVCSLCPDSMKYWATATADKIMEGEGQ